MGSHTYLSRIAAKQTVARDTPRHPLTRFGGGAMVSVYGEFKRFGRQESPAGSDLRSESQGLRTGACHGLRSGRRSGAIMEGRWRIV